MTTIGPRLRIVASCHGCEYVRFTPSTTNHFSFTECDHSRAPQPRVIENTHLVDSTPQWCPMLKKAIVRFSHKLSALDLMADDWESCLNHAIHPDEERDKKVGSR